MDPELATLTSTATGRPATGDGSLGAGHYNAASTPSGCARCAPTTPTCPASGELIDILSPDNAAT
jgi:hypothetical protein